MILPDATPLPAPRKRSAPWPLIGLAAIALLVRLPPLGGQSLWTDELFSLAMATGHSVEHSAADARPDLGDYVEPPDPVPAVELARYVAHDEPPAGPRRVLRAIHLSDTSPPFYYLLLWAWTRIFGVSGVALRALSVAASVATIALLPGLARRCGGRRAVLPAALLFALAPAAVHYGSEGRMYALAGLLVAAQLRTTLALRRRGRRRSAWAAWIALAVAGLLTHYFYLFPLAACALWLLAQRVRVGGRPTLAATVLVALLVLPWYAGVPASPGDWRISAGWLDGFPPFAVALAAPLRLAFGFASAVGPWGGELRFERSLVLLVGGAVAALGLALLRRRGGRALLLCALAAAAACLGLLAVDLAQDTRTVLVQRYALAGLPAALIVLACGFARMPRALAMIALAATVALWTPALRAITQNSHRMSQSFGEIGSHLDARLGKDDLIVMHSIPTCFAGLARELNGPAPLFPWVEQLGVRRAPADVERAIAGRRVVACVEMHTVGAAAPACEWLRRHALTVEATRVGGATVRLFRPPEGDRFPRP